MTPTDAPRTDARARARAAAPDAVLVSVADVCRLLTLSRASVWRLMDRGELPFVRIGGARRIRRADVDRLARGP